MDRIEIEIEITEKDFLMIATMAHERDITFNDMCNIILEKEINEFKTKDEKKSSDSKKSSQTITSSLSSTN